MQILYLFPDTNLFIQGRPLRELDWSDWTAFDEVRLIVSRPVQREIDHQKGRGGDRVGKRARATHSLFREVITGDDGYKLIQEAAPQVRLYVEPQWLPAAELADRLDYSKTDDEIVGALHAFRAAHPEDDARLLTHDSGPMASAKMLDLPFIAVPDEWFIPPENNEEEKENQRLKSELSRLRRTGPEFEVRCFDADDNETDALEFEHCTFQPLSDAQLDALIESLKQRFPAASDFGGRERKTRRSALPMPLAGMSESFEPASDEEITRYQEEDYPGWLSRCEAILRQLHTGLQREAGPPVFHFEAANSGTRPGKDVLITFTARGDLQIRPADRADDDDDDDGGGSVEDLATRLPLPPKPPRGTWTRSFGARPFQPFAALDQIRALQSHIDPFTHGHGNSLVHMTDILRPPPPHDPNAFYYKPWRPLMPMESYSLECDQWRHNLEPHVFSGEIYFAHEAGDLRGALECTIHAENLPDPLRKTVPVRVSVRIESTQERAQTLIAELAVRVAKKGYADE